MSRYFLNSPPMARAMSPKADRIWGLTDLCTFSFCREGETAVKHHAKVTPNKMIPQFHHRQLFPKFHHSFSRTGCTIFLVSIKGVCSLSHIGVKKKTFSSLNRLNCRSLKQFQVTQTKHNLFLIIGWASWQIPWQPLPFVCACVCVYASSESACACVCIYEYESVSESV